MLGGALPLGRGYFYPPTALSDVAPGMAAYEEELFGPVAAIVPAADEADALRIANASRYGLGATVFSRDRERGERIATRQLEAGNCFVNAAVRSDPSLPFGGIKDSGYGREQRDGPRGKSWTSRGSWRATATTRPGRRPARCHERGQSHNVTHPPASRVC